MRGWAAFGQHIRTDRVHDGVEIALIDPVHQRLELADAQRIQQPKALTEVPTVAESLPGFDASA